MAALSPDQISTPEARAIPRPGRYEIDISASAVTFRTRHLFGLAPVRGRFAIRAGTIDVGEPLARASTRIDRNEFGVTACRGMAGRYLDMTIEVRCVRT